MNRINEYNIEPGPYADQHGNVLVVLDVVNHTYNADKDLPEALPDPVVILRDLIEPQKEHRRYMYPIEIFKQNFTKK